MSMNAEIKARWLAALRSGDYVKTRGRLHRIEDSVDDFGILESGYCCLGVLCDLAKADNIVVEYQADSDSNASTFGCTDNSEDLSRTTLPECVVEWSGVSADFPSVHRLGHDETLAYINDRPDTTFEQIADLIEEQL